MVTPFSRNRLLVSVPTGMTLTKTRYRVNCVLASILWGGSKERDTTVLPDNTLILVGISISSHVRRYRPSPSGLQGSGLGCRVPGSVGCVKVEGVQTKHAPTKTRPFPSAAQLRKRSNSQLIPEKKKPIAHLQVPPQGKKPGAGGSKGLMEKAASKLIAKGPTRPTEEVVEQLLDHHDGLLNYGSGYSSFLVGSRFVFGRHGKSRVKKSLVSGNVNLPSPADKTASMRFSVSLPRRCPPQERSPHVGAKTRSGSGKLTLAEPSESDASAKATKSLSFSNLGM
ncbi:hypothetical protein GOBAR_AA34234 [Gossypium barbadense]|uniref:Uncharacterized protein n=1 Tax=Gossypium barbadense TaxID=3634 RepID=A0A2P5W5R2_GOSBA|nr:hypothetical protein GOBAR_AA34234 [Gossypium barbadense]